MNYRTKVVLICACLLALSAPILAQQRDPLTDAESDELREQALEPMKRLKLMIRFATERLNQVDLTRQAPASPDRPKRIHQSLTDFRAIVDELDDNIDDYSDKHMDMRKPLQEVVQAESEFQKRLQAIQQAGSDPKNASDFQMYDFALKDAIESVSLSLDDAKKTLEEQTEAMKDKKKK